MIYLGIDIGTTSAKCLAVDEQGTILALAQHPYPMHHPRQGWAEQDPEDYWQALINVVRECMDKCQGEVAAMALSTQGDTLIVTDSDGKHLRPAMSWMDTRGEDECRELLAEESPGFWYRETGIPLAVTSSACSIRWLRRHEPGLRTERICFVPDYLAFRLTGRHAIDVPSASWSSLYNPFIRDWSKPVMEVLEVEAGQLPEPLESGEVIGDVLPEVCELLGLRAPVKLVSGAFDQAAAALGAGASPGERSVLSCGTAWVLTSVSDSPIEDATERIPVYCHTSPTQWGMVLPFTGGAAYDWLNDVIAPDGKASDADRLVLIPHLYGGLCPDWQSQSRGSLLGLTMSHTAEDIRLAMMRGIACEARRNMEAAERLIGTIGSIRMVGGAGKSDVWPQMVANVLGRTVEVSDCVESACYGAARLAAGTASDGWNDPGTIRTCIPDDVEVDAENRFYARYLRAYEALLDLYHQSHGSHTSHEWRNTTVTGKEIRLGHLFSGGENAVVVAADHGEFDGPLPGMIDLPAVVGSIDPCVDAILLSPGMLPHCGHAFNRKGAPLAIVRANWSSHFCFHWDYQEGIAVPAASVEDLVAAGAEMVLICLTLHTGSEVRDASNVEVFAKLAGEARGLGIPVVGEYFPARPDRLSPEELHDEVWKGCRIIAELGADLVKTFSTIKFDEVTKACPVPILGLGAEKTPRQIDALQLAERIVGGGGKGVVFGRNAIQVANPPAFQRALCDVVKKGVSPAEAAARNGLTD